jgi:hypothetical protein
VPMMCGSLSALVGAYYGFSGGAAKKWLYLYVIRVCQIEWFS